MKLAIIGSRTITAADLPHDLAYYLPPDTTEIVTGGAKGIDTSAAEFAEQRGIKLTVFPPQYPRFGRSAPLRRNEQIADYADGALAFWDGRSRGTMHTVGLFRTHGKPVVLLELPDDKAE
ncbi:MAG: DUF2493 domain-containing protein [Ruminococcaceae bacterium]|nr:DUF2493 domain-containing protein [Oscillospiraceae bacterium]